MPAQLSYKSHPRIGAIGIGIVDVDVAVDVAVAVAVAGPDQRIRD